ncbi:MAG: cobalt ECF transporter T component CbiQ [Micromonosporaceae bacterium]|nr:cobalt ECF transporter T component CbiQ [Micromonosporaceae bacterium]
MAGGHSHPLYLDQSSPVHRLAPEVKIVASVGFTVLMVLTPRTEFWAFGVYLLLLLGVAFAARVSPWWLATRSLIEAPFVVLAVLLPFLGSGPRVDWLGLSLSVEGLLGAWNIVAKATLGVLSSLLLAATTQMRDLVLGLDRLRCPAVVTQIVTFMLRYAEVLAAEARRMRIARISRGDSPRFLWQARGFAVGAGALFLRAFERGERVYLAMVSRGYTGRLPALYGPGPGLAQWSAALALPVAAGLVLAVAAGRAVFMS